MTSTSRPRTNKERYPWVRLSCFSESLASVSFFYSSAENPNTKMSSKPLPYSESPQHRRNVVVVDDVIHPSAVIHEVTTKQSSGVAERHSDPLPILSGYVALASATSTESLFESKENLSKFLSVEDRLLDELKTEIFACNARTSDLNQELKQIQPLERRVEELERTQNKLTNEIAFKHDLIESLKQRVSVLHEQNKQLARIVENSKSGSADVLSTRNALVASLAQLKTLQDQVNTIPELKSQIKILSAENSKYHNISSEMNLSDRCEYPSYDSLCKEKFSLKAKNETLVKGTEVLRADLLIVANSCEGLKKRLDMFEKSLLSVSVFEERMKKLEEEKDELYRKTIDLKCSHSDHKAKLDVTVTPETVAELEILNSSLLSKLEHMQIHSRTQKAKLALKLLQMEALSVKTHTSEIEKQVLDIEHTTHSGISSLASASASDLVVLAPSFKVQLLKLQQIQSLREQSHSVLKLFHSDKQEADRKIAELQSVAEKQEGGHADNLGVALARITYLEEKLEAFDVGGTEKSSSQWSMESGSQTGAEKDYNSLLHEYQSLKKENRKARKKVKASQEKLRCLAKELTNSVDLLKQFQSQCMVLQDELNHAKSENQREIQSNPELSASNVQSCVEERPNHVTHKTQDIMISGNNTSLEKDLKEKLVCEERERQKLTEHFVELEVKIELLKSAVSAGENEIDQLKKDIEVLTCQLKQTEELLHFQNNAKDVLEAELLTYKTEKLPSLTVEVGRMENQMRELETVIGEKEIQARESDTALFVCEVSRKEMVCGMQQLAEQKDRLYCENKYLLEKVEQQQTELLSKTQKNEHLHHEAVMLTAKLDSQTTMIESFQRRSHEHQLQAESNAESLQTEVNMLCQDIQQRSESQNQLKHELESVKLESQVHVDELLGCQATIESLRRQLDMAETREIEHEELKLRIRRLERTISASSQLKHDNEALLGMLHVTINEMPTLSSETGTELQQENHRLEEQVSVLSQWNDKQRREIEELETRLECVDSEKHQLLLELMTKESSAQENAQLKREIKEVEAEVTTLHQQVRADLNEEIKIKLATQTKILSVFNEHNASLQKQIEDLHAQVRSLGGSLERDKPVSPPPMLDGAFIVATEDKHISDLGRENDILKRQISYLESEIKRLHDTSLVVKRRSGSFCATSSVPLAIVDEDFQETVPPEMLLPCSLMADHLNTKTVDDLPAKAWLESIRTEWIRCVSQKAVSQSCVECYVTTISTLSSKLLQIVVNLQDKKGNSALHHAIRNGNFPMVKLLIQLNCCETNITNHAGYTPLMMLCATNDVNVDAPVSILQILMRKGNVNYQTQQHLCTPLMLAAGAGQPRLVDMLLESGATVNAQDKDGSTALMFAVQNGHINILKRLLIAPNCDVRLQDSDGLTVEDISNAAGYAEVSLLLKEYALSKTMD